MSVNKQLDNPFERAERIRVLEAEISFNANEINNATILMNSETRQSEFCVVESAIEWYEKQLEALRNELQEWMCNADAEYKHLKQRVMISLSYNHVLFLTIYITTIVWCLFKNTYDEITKKEKRSNDINKTLCESSINPKILAFFTSLIIITPILNTCILMVSFFKDRSNSMTSPK